MLVNPPDHTAQLHYFEEPPGIFGSVELALDWGCACGAFGDREQALRDWARLKAEWRPRDFEQMSLLWVDAVKRRVRLQVTAPAARVHDIDISGGPKNLESKTLS